jgi:hypothetical protein
MKRFITAMLTLALITGLSCGKASAQQANAVPLLALAMQSSSGQIEMVVGAAFGNGICSTMGVNRSVPLAGTNSGLHSMSSPLFRSSTTAIMDPADCPSVLDMDSCDTSGLESALSSNDPIFFSHHANVDYIW